MEIERTAASAPPDSMRDQSPLNAAVSPSLLRPRSAELGVAPYDTFGTGIVSSSSVEAMCKLSTHDDCPRAMPPTTAHSCRLAAARSRPRHLLCPTPATCRQRFPTQCATRLR
jgi:hypothetical protein